MREVERGFSGLDEVAIMGGLDCARLAMIRE